MNVIINALAFPAPPRGGRASTRLRADPKLVWLDARGEKVPALHVRYAGAPMHRGRFLILYSHGNAEDLAELSTYIEYLSRKTGADVLAYEYPGYSIADGSASEAGCYAAAMAAYEWAVRPAADNGGGAAPHEVVPFGRSLGSAPACYMASQVSAPVGGLLLQSPLLSGANAMLGQTVAFVGFCVDPFKNYDYIKRARCRVAICHGTVDGVVPCWNGRKLHALVGADAHEPLWCVGCGHNDMEIDAVFSFARGFLGDLDARRAT
jgi:fermentation-respiration switch protein FrsA (DUF1100 family)